MHFPKIKISLNCFVEFKSKKSQDVIILTTPISEIETAEMKALQIMIDSGQPPSEYKMSTRREINISITF